jgi:hypothetical protein
MRTSFVSVVRSKCIAYATIAVEHDMPNVERNPAERFPATPMKPRFLVGSASIVVSAAYACDRMGMNIQTLHEPVVSF